MLARFLRETEEETYFTKFRLQSGSPRRNGGPAPEKQKSGSKGS